MPNLLLRACAVAALVTVAVDAGAAGAPRRRFEPTDLELEDPGALVIDLQYGFAQSGGPARLVAPDAEIGLGITRRFELDVDFAFAVEGADLRAFSADHWAVDNPWVAAKLGLFDARTPTGAWALGTELGPKIPFGRLGRGAGFEGLVLGGYALGRMHLVANLGGLIDPGAEISQARPAGVALGLDLDVDLDDRGALSFVGELGSVIYLSPDPNQLHATAGIAWAPTRALQLSLIELWGLPPGDDRFALLFGIAPRVWLWR